MQLESSSETRSALENQLERLTRDKVCVGQFYLFILSMFAVPKSCFLFVFDNGFNFFYVRSTSWLNWSRQKAKLWSMRQK